MKIYRKITRLAKRWQRLLWSVLAIAIMAGSIVYWHYGIFDKPGRAWQDMLSSSLSTSSLTLQTDQAVDGNTRKQVVDYETGKVNQAHSFTDINQTDNSVRLETIGTFDADYTRYVAINVKDKDYSSAIGSWAKDDHASQATSNNAQLLPDVVLRLGSGFGVPFASVSVDKQAELLKQLTQSVISADMTNVSRQTVDGQAAFVYKATINGQAYATYLKAFAEALGFTQLSSYDTSTSQQQSVDIEMVVSRSSHHLIKMTYPGLDGYTETYANYNKAVNIPALPDQTITYDELQAKFN